MFSIASTLDAGSSWHQHDVVCGFMTDASLPSSAGHPGLQGSGKTLAFGLPIIQRLLAEGGGEAGGHAPRTATPPSPLRGLILLPTRELALQVAAGSPSVYQPATL